MTEEKKESEKKRARIRDVGLLFVLFLKIGLFTFGGGYAMISLIRREFIEKRKWVTAPEFTDMIAVSESTPGPLAINSATYVGYKIAGFWGSLVATVGVVIPSFTIIYVISLFLEQFLELALVAAAFKGIQVAVAVLILSAGIKMFREMEKKPVTVAMAVLVFAAMLCLDIFALSFSSVYMILIGAGVGLAFYVGARVKKNRAAALSVRDAPAEERGERTLDSENDAECEERPCENAAEPSVGAQSGGEDSQEGGKK